ncbi:MAG: sugar phosphate isomerase/epimerase [Clostridia bacterium]|nr:sugar phosphate isomerase/epimerase [Clostridia bacterium]
MMKQDKFGISVGLGFPESAEDQIAAIARVGYDACFTGWNHERMESWANAVAKNGLIYQSVHAPFNKAHKMWEAGREGEDYTDMLIQCVEDCKRFDIGIMVAHVIIGMDRHFPSALGITRFRRLVEAGEKNGVKIAFENTEGIEYLQAIMDHLGASDHCCFCWDTGHEQCYNYGEDMMARFGNKLIATHLNDNFGMADRNKMTWLDDSHVLPFDGINDWKSIIDRMDKAGYNGIYTMELTRNAKPNKNTHDAYAAWSLDEFLAEALNRMHRMVALRG